jgi:2-phosphoglycerate kinase
MRIQQHILDVGDGSGVPAFENSDLDETVQSIALLIMDTLRKGPKDG